MLAVAIAPSQTRHQAEVGGPRTIALRLGTGSSGFRPPCVSRFIFSQLRIGQTGFVGTGELLDVI